MRRFTRFAGGAAAAAVLLLLAPVPASAGGPTSVLLVSPARQATASLYTTDDAYSRLLRLVGDSPTRDAAAPDLRGGPGSDAVNITWLIHDVQIWRVDRVFTDAKDGPWIETTMLLERGSAFDQAGVMHRPSDPEELISLLSAMRLLGAAPPPPALQGAAAPDTGADAEPVSQQVANVAAEQDVASIDWLWALIGAAGGAVLVVGLRPLVRRVRRN